MKVYPTSLFQDRDPGSFSTCGYLVNSLWKESLLKYGDIVQTDIENCDAVFLFISWMGDEYVFDKKSASKIAFLQKPIVVIDFTEYGGYGAEARLSEYNIYGYKLEFSNLLHKDHRKIHEFLSENQSLVKCYFKRELGATIDISPVPFKVEPIDYIHDSYVGNETPESYDDYFKRPIRYNFVWGYSSPSRPQLHGAILQNIEKFQSQFALSFPQCDEILKTNESFILLNYVPWYSRIPHSQLMTYQKQSRVVIDLYGCGMKCFRNAESTVNCLSAKQDPSKLKSVYPWIDGENCIFLPNRSDNILIDIDKTLEILLKYQHEEQHLLYPMYVKSLEMNRLYAPRNYIPAHIMKHAST